MIGVIASAIAVSVSLSAGSPGAPHTFDPGANGPYTLGHTSFLLVDSSRNTQSPWGGRPVPVNVWYPADDTAIAAETPRAAYALDSFESDSGRPGWPSSSSSDWELVGMAPAYENVPASPDKPFPLVLVSPGWTNRYYNLFFYAERLASHGFVVAIVEHYLDGAYAFEPWGMDLGLALLHRPADVSFMLDGTLARNDDPTSVLFGSVRPDLIAASGHSLGGYAAMALVAGDDEVCATLGEPLSCSSSLGTTSPDSRIKAIVSMDGSNQVLHFSELARITVPAIAIGRPWETSGNWNARLHAAVSGRPAYRVDVRNALHPSFTNNCTTPKVLYAKGLISATGLANALKAPPCNTAPDQMEVNRLAAKYAVAFLKTQLAGEKGYQDILTPGWALAVEHYIEFFVTEPANATALGEDPGTFRFFLHQPGSETSRAERDPKFAVIDISPGR